MSETVTTEGVAEEVVAAPTSDTPQPPVAESATGPTPAENVTSSPTDGKGAAETEAVQDDSGSDSNALSDLYKDPESDSSTDEGTNNQASVGEYDFTDVKPTSGAEASEYDKNLVTGIGKTLGLNNDQARRLLEQGGALIQQQREAVRKKYFDEWGKQIMADKELGGANYRYTRANLVRVIKTYGGGPDGEAFKVLEKSGLSQHPAIVRMLNAIGRDMGEDNKFVRGEPAVRPRTQADRYRAMYNHSPDLNFEG